MTIPEDGYLLRIFVGESDRHGHHPLYEAIVLKAREQGLAGATVLRGLMGFGKHSILHTAKILRLSEDLHLRRHTHPWTSQPTIAPPRTSHAELTRKRKRMTALITARAIVLMSIREASPS
jgi:hypothetical protein